MTLPTANASRELWPWLRRNAAWLLLVAVAAALGVAGTCYQRNQRLKESARLVAQNDVFIRHWQALETVSDFKPVIDALFRGLDGAASGQHWKIRSVQSRTTSPVALDAFEKQALERIAAGQDEVWQQRLTGSTRYVRAVRAKQGCIVCHVTSGSGTMTKENDIIGVLSLESVAGAANASETTAGALARRD